MSANCHETLYYYDSAVARALVNQFAYVTAEKYLRQDIFKKLVKSLLPFWKNFFEYWKHLIGCLAEPTNQKSQKFKKKVLPKKGHNFDLTSF